MAVSTAVGCSARKLAMTQPPTSSSPKQAGGEARSNADGRQPHNGTSHAVNALAYATEWQM
eukprot:353939-Chlamydomonas_euryale.AAC.3